MKPYQIVVLALALLIGLAIAAVDPVGKILRAEPEPLAYRSSSTQSGPLKRYVVESDGVVCFQSVESGALSCLKR